MIASSHFKGMISKHVQKATMCQINRTVSEWNKQYCFILTLQSVRLITVAVIKKRKWQSVRM